MNHATLARPKVRSDASAVTDKEKKTVHAAMRAALKHARHAAADNIFKDRTIKTNNASAVTGRAVSPAAFAMNPVRSPARHVKGRAL